MTPGIYTLAAADYHADPCDEPSLSSTIARLLVTASPLHAWTAHPRLNPNYRPEVADKFDVGTCAHSLMLEGVDMIAVVDAPDWRTKLAQEARDEARANGQVPLLAKQAEQVQAMLATLAPQLDRVHANPRPFTDGKAEQALIWPEDGVWCRACCDWLRDDNTVIDDYKTTSASANPERFSRILFDRGYDVQAAFYLRGLRALTGTEAEFRFVVQETRPPYALSVVALTPAALALASEKVSYAIQLWRDCLTTNTWPAYSTEIAYADAPGWEVERWMEKRALEEAAA